MAITYLTGTLNPASSTKARDIRQAWAAAFSGISGWTLVDHNYVNGTSERSVLTNTAGFALMILNSTNTSTLTVRVFLGQSYNTGTHTLSNLGFGFITAKASNSSGFSGTSFNPTSLAALDPTTEYHGLYDFTATGSQTEWTAHIDSDNAILSYKDGSVFNGRAVVFGAYNTLVSNPSLTDSNPFAMVCSGASASGGGVILQSLGNNSATILHGIRNFFSNKTIPVATLAYADKYSSTPALGTVSPIFIARESVLANSLTYAANTYGHVRGSLKNCLGTNTLGAIYGDTLTLPSGKIYKYVGGTSNSDLNTAIWALVN